MKLRFKDWKIRTKILISFIALIIFFLYIIVNSFTAIVDFTSNKIPLLLANEAINSELLEMRNNEKDFLLYEISDPDFFADGKSIYLEQFEESYINLVTNLNSVSESSDIHNNKDLIDQLSEIEETAKVYHENFLKVVESIKVRGHEDYGYEGELRTSIHELEDKITEPEQLIDLLQARRAEKDYFLRQDLEYVTKLDGYVTDLQKNLLESGDTDKISFLEEYQAKFHQLVDLEKEIGLTDSEGLKGEYQAAVTKLSPMLEAFHGIIMENLNNQVTDLIKITIISVLIIIIVVLLFSFYVSKLITKPIIMTNQMLKDIAEGEGDLTRKLTIDTKEELGTLAVWFNIFIGKIKDIVGIVQNNADIIAGSSEKLSNAAENANQGIDSIAREVTIITDGLQNNASVIEEASASIQEIASGAVLVSTEAENATINSQNVLDTARDGAGKLKEMVEVMQNIKESSVHIYGMMEELKDSSVKINEIAELITGISEQTNLLALNAAIEAARAGESGKGFAVVAEEVRKLAENSKQSADDITNLIKTIENKVDVTYIAMKEEQELVNGSVQKATETDSRFKDILGLIGETTNKIKTISEAAKQQSIAANEMSKAMEEISASTQESAASSQQISSSITEQVNTFEEINAGISDLSSIAQTLKDQTNRFKTK